MTQHHARTVFFIDTPVSILIKDLAWALTSVGDISDWPPELRTLVSFILGSEVAMIVLWGEDGALLYNYAYARFSGDRHPGILGRPISDAWPEAAEFRLQSQ
jgi:hypothetical protein